jgi:hypothetical protein
MPHSFVVNLRELTRADIFKIITNCRAVTQKIWPWLFSQLFSASVLQHRKSVTFVWLNYDFFQSLFYSYQQSQESHLNFK